MTPDQVEKVMAAVLLARLLPSGAKPEELKALHSTQGIQLRVGWAVLLAKEIAAEQDRLLVDSIRDIGRAK
jgi:hypothetical protein